MKKIVFNPITGKFDYIDSFIGETAGGDLGGTYPNPTVTDDSHNHTVATLPAFPVGANPTASAGLVAVNGIATTFMRSDGAPAVNASSNPGAAASVLASTVAGGLTLQTFSLPTTTSTVGQIIQNANTIFHTYNNTANQYNIFLGKSVGNYTLTPLADYGIIGIGSNVLTANTTGYGNFGIGLNVLAANTTGYGNVAMGSFALQNNVDGNSNFALGYGSLNRNVSGFSNVCIGSNSGYWILSNYNVSIGDRALGNTSAQTSGGYNTALGFYSMSTATSSIANAAMGYQALKTITQGGYNTACGANALPAVTTTSNNTAIGYAAGYANAGTGNIFVGYEAGFYETGSNTLLVDNQLRTNEAAGRLKGLLYGIFNAAPASQSLTVNGVIKGQIQSALTNTIQNILTIDHQTTGTAAASFGASQTWSLQSSTTASQTAARMRVLWSEATHATRKAQMILSAYDTAERDAITIAADGSRSQITNSGTLTLRTGSATAGTAPIKFVSGTLLGTIEEGAVEFDGDYFYSTSGVMTGVNHRRRIVSDDRVVSFNDEAIFYEDNLVLL